MKLALVKSLWGVPAAGNTAEWDDMFAKIAEEGFSAVETIGLVWGQDPELFRTLAARHGLRCIAQVHTAGGYIKDGNYVYCASPSVEEHTTSFRAQVLAALQLDPVLINVHSGHDSWNSSTAISYFLQALAIEKEIASSIVIVHETHRQRLMFNPFQTLEILSCPELIDLKINADLSHWACVCERLFDDIERDPWWPVLLSLVAQHCHFVHARIGHAEGPQVIDPRRPEFAPEVNAHLSWWEAIWKSQRARKLEYSYVETEHGPEPYQSYHARPARSATVAAPEDISESEKGEILWEINAHVAFIVSQKYDALRVEEEEKS
jgi:hypothetical protein